ncbi:glutathione binding-like protein [Klebsiella pneumoniae]|nr:glutathione binding-like protein [Klebsiella pneumoniae]
MFLVGGKTPDQSVHLNLTTTTQRLYGVLNQRLGCSPWLGGDHYSIADIAAWPWVNCHVRQRIDLANYPAVHNWYERIKQRPATSEAMLKIQLY